MLGTFQFGKCKLGRCIDRFQQYVMIPFFILITHIYRHKTIKRYSGCRYGQPIITCTDFNACRFIFCSAHTAGSKSFPDTLAELECTQHFTQPPAHYTEAALVKALEEHGIGRPSTYAPTITTLLARRYVLKENKNLHLTELGEAVNTIMKEAFATIVDEEFTANMEMLLDKVEEGDISWKTIISNFYPDLEEAVEKAEKTLEKVQIADEVTDIICEECGRNMVIKYGPHGKFLACPGFPDCRNTKPYLEKIGVACPKCGKDIVVRKTKKGRRFYGCEAGPDDCDFMSWQKPYPEKCPKCGGYMVEKGSKIVCADAQCGYVCERKSDVNKEP